MATGPRPGDIVVVPDMATDDYLVQVFRGATQLRFFSREDAVRDATTFAEIHRVDVWYTRDGTLYERTVICRSRRRPARAAS